MIPRHYQLEAINKTLHYLNTKDGNPIIALPTGSGKSLVLAEIASALNLLGDSVLIVSHVKEILEQNAKAIREQLSIEPAINSSMLGRREIGNITIAGIQSIYRNPEYFDDFKYVIIDECHLVSDRPESMYMQLISGMNSPRVIGLTATPFRLGTGYLHTSSGIFTDISCDWTSKERFQQLIDENFLCKLTTKRTDLEMDTSGIKLVAGDLNEKQLAERFDRDKVTNEAIKEILAAGKYRSKWLVFAIDIAHAEHIAEQLIRCGIPTAPVHSRMDQAGFDREATIDGFKNGKYKCVTNVNILTTGFDHPGVDLIAMLRPTNSPILHVQSLGRGGRVSPGKRNCLVLDFAGNTVRLGPVNDVLVQKAKKGDKEGEAITKTCPDCDEILPPAVRICPECDFEFHFEHHLSSLATTAEVVDDGKFHWVKVSDVKYTANTKVGAPSSVRVDYKYQGGKVSEYICIEHTGFAKHKADHWCQTAPRATNRGKE